MTAHVGLRGWLVGARDALSFLTVLPIAQRWPGRADGLPRAVGFFPLVGLALGLATWGLGAALRTLSPQIAHGGMATWLAGALLTAWLALATGALHLDGIADLADAAAGARGDRERALRILRDPRVGSAGAVALVLVLALRVGALAQLTATAGAALCLGPVVARAFVVPFVLWAQRARSDGKAVAFVGTTRVGALVALAICTTATATALGLVGGVPVAALAAAGVAGFAIYHLGRHLLGGMTGDVFGAMVEAVETALFVAAAM